MLYIAARDIGNYKDNTERLKEILIKSDIILAESFKFYYAWKPRSKY